MPATPQRVIVLDKIAPEGLALLQAADGIEHEVRTGLKGDDLRLALAEFDGAICRSGVKITADALAGNRRLRAIVRAGVGVDNIDRDAATRLGIVVMNTPTGNTQSTAEHTVAMMLALSRHIAPANQSLANGVWDRAPFSGTQLAGKTLAIVGLGRIGQTVARIAQALQMRLLGYDPYFTAERASELGVEMVPSVRDLLPRADYITVHVPGTPETFNLIGEPELDLLKPGVRLVNCARGGIYNEQALVKGLDSGRIAGVALDVFVDEPCQKHPLFGRKNVVCTPHLGASTEEAQKEVAVEGVNLLIDYLTTGAIRHAVNMTPIDPKALADIRGYLNLAYRLGLLMAQYARGNAQSCHVRYRGDIGGKQFDLITSAFAAGLLEKAFAQDVNIVNAAILLKERGIELASARHSDVGPGTGGAMKVERAFSSSMRVDVKTDQGEFVASGTLFGNAMPRLIRLGAHRLEAYLDGTMLVFEHRDVPGIIGAIGTVFGRHQVNIAQMSVGRADAQTSGHEAVGVLSLDSDPPPAALEEVRQHPAIQSVTVLKLPPVDALPPWLAG